MSPGRVEQRGHAVFLLLILAVATTKIDGVKPAGQAFSCTYLVVPGYFGIHFTLPDFHVH